MATPIDVYGLSPTQEGMLFHALYAPGEGVYFEQRWCVLEGTLDTELFRAAWQQVVARHDVLRSGFHWREVDRPVQVVYDTATLDWVVDDWQTDGGDDRLRQFLAADRARGFALDAAPLMRCALFQLGPNRHRFVWSYHHLLMDGWCNGVLIAEVLTCYDALRRGAVASLPPTRPYRDFIDWLQQQDPAPAERYWRGTLRGFDAPTPLGIDRIVVDGPGRFHEVQRDVAPATRAALQAFARSARLTLNTVCQGAWALLLARYSGQSDVLFGATLSGRPPTLAGAQRMVGLFISTVPVRVRVDPERSVVDALRSLQAAQRDREQYGHCALTALQRWSDVPVGTPLFDSVLVFENYPVSLDAALGTGDGSLTLADGGGYERTNYPLAIMVLPTDGALRIVVRHDTARIDAAAAERLLRHFETVLLGLTRPDMTFGSVPVPDANECATLEQWGRGVAVAVDPVPVHALFAAQARTRGDAIALVFEPGASAAAAVALSYAELNTRANRLAVHLRAEGVAPGARVGVCMGRSVELVVALLAVLKTGAAYVPLDPDYPAERLAFIVADAGLDRLLVAGLDGIASAGDVPVVDVTADAARIAASSDADPHIDVRSDDLAYLIYTSGSTGRPKGVAICHRSLRNFIDAMAVAPGLDPEDRLLAVTTVSFDIAGLELFLPLARGARLVLASSGVARDPQQLAAALDRHAIRVMQASPATWRLLMDIGWAGRRELKALCGGEALDRGLATWLHGRVAALWNLYGPTETTIWSAALRIEPRHLTGDTVPFGGAIANTRLHVLDDRLQPAPIGVDGELYIGGAGLSAGYWNRPDLTAAAFVPDPFSTDPAARLYRTGDRVRFRDDGLLTFVGRRDHQIKLRGFRIELGEIEAALGRYPNVMQAVAIVRRDDPDNPQLVAYVVSAAGAAPDVDRLREHLRGLLPAPMVPAAIVVLDRMPLTPNGKVDRRALPAPTSATSATVVGAEVAADPLQELVAGIWADVLGRDRVVPQDDFFALGGHSLLATGVGRGWPTCAASTLLRVLLEQSRLAAFVEAIAADTTSRQAATTIPPLPDGAELPSFAQQRQVDRAIEPDSNAYSIPVVLRLRGPIDVARIERSFDRIVQRHQTLRTVFRAVDGRPCAEVSPWAPTRMPVIDVRMVGDIDRQAQIDAQVQTLVGLPFDLAQSPLWRLRLLRTADDDHVLVLVLHHIVADDWSIGVLVREWATFYQADTDQPVAAVPPLGVQYADFAAWQRTLDFQPDLDYWRAQLRDLPPALALPTDRGNADETPRGARFEFRLDAAQTASLHHLGRQHGATLFMTLLAGFDVLLSRWCDGTDIAVGTPIANRRRADLEGLIGMFVNTLVLRTDLGGNPPVDALLARVRRMTLGAYEHQDVPFEQVIDALPVVRGTGRSPLFQVLFALQNTPPPMIAIDDLQWSALPFTTAAAKFDLSLSFRETGDGLHGVFEYRADRFEPATIARMAGHYRRLLRQMVAHPQRRIAELAMLGADEMQQLDAWGTGPAQPPVSDTVHGAFAQQVAATPDAVAVVHGDWRCTYRELDRRSNRLAHLLRAADVGRGALVGLWAERSPDAIVAMLAI
ncbi:MAG: amino acid adenylation domain-containing protein, partial [Burkholderiales bacterium]|nr:amino acid adenylation domain-containing protein [Burkholderiales bacterium]